MTVIIFGMKTRWDAIGLMIFAAVAITHAGFLDCKANNPVANAYCADYCYSIHPGRHVAGLCARDEVSCICETEGNTFIKVRVLQDTEPAPWVEPTFPPIPILPEDAVVYQPLPAVMPSENENGGIYDQAPPDPPLDEAQELVCDGSVEAWNVCNSFCVDIIRASSGTCVTDDSTCRCSNVPDQGQLQIDAALVAAPNHLADVPSYQEAPVVTENDQGNIPMHQQWTYGQNYQHELPPPQLPSFYTSMTNGYGLGQAAPTMQVPLPYEHGYQYDVQGFFPPGLAMTTYPNPGGSHLDGQNPLAGFYNGHNQNHEARVESGIQGPLEIAPRAEVSVEE